MSRKRSRKTLLEISNQPELWIFSNLLLEEWVNRTDVKNAVFEKRVNIPISLPSGTCVFKIESDGLKGQIISIAIVHGSELHLIQLIEPSSFSKFKELALRQIKKIYSNSFDFYSYLSSYYEPKMRDFGIREILGMDTNVKDLAEYGEKSRILQRIADPIEGYEVPQYWRLNERLVTIVPDTSYKQELVLKLRVKVCDNLAKHAAIEGLRCAVLALKHYADLLDSLTSEIPLKPFDEYQTFADSLYELGDYQDSALFYSKCLSHVSFKDEKDRELLMNALRDSVERLEPKDFLEYALFAAKISKSFDD